MGKDAPGRGHETESTGVVWNGNGHAADMDAGDEGHKTVANDAELLMGRERSDEVLQGLARRRFVRWRSAMKHGHSNRQKAGTAVAS